MLDLDLNFLQLPRRAQWLAMRPGDRLSMLRRHRLLPFAQSGAPEALAVDERVLAQLLEALHSERIRVLVLKGAALAHWLYSGSGLRPRTDTDLLIDASDRIRATALLERHGYRSLAASAHDAISQQMSFSSARPDAGVIDLHFALSNQPEFATRFRFADLAQASIPLPRLSANARGLGPVHALLHAVMHYYAHHPADERPAIWLLDIALIARGLEPAQWTEVDGCARMAGISGLLAGALTEAESWFECPYPPARLAAWQSAGAREWRSERLGDGNSHLRELGLALRGLPTMAARAGYLWRRLFPSVEWMRANEPIRSNLELPLAYLLRLWRGLLRRLH